MPPKKSPEGKEEKQLAIVIREKTQRVRAPSGAMLTLREVSQLTANKTLPYGVYHGHCEVMGPLNVWGIPWIEDDLSGLSYALKNIGNYKKLKDQYINLIETNPVVQWHLIPVLLDEAHFKQRNPGLKKLKSWDTVSVDPEFYISLTQHGAHYKHYMLGAYETIKYSVVEKIHRVFGADAIHNPYGEGTFIATFLGYHFDIDNLVLQLRYGADINERIDKRFNNTILHHLIALEISERAVGLIDFFENGSLPAGITSINYRLQDRQGKTALYLAVALGDEPVVDALLSLLKTKHKDIGLDTPDEQGRTPLMIAAALGNKRIVEKLLCHGANLHATDCMSRDITWYMNASYAEVAKILRFVSVNPERGYYVSFTSNLSSSTKNNPPFVVVKKNGEEHLILITTKEPHFSYINGLREALRNHPEMVAYIDRQIEALTPKAGPHYQKTLTDKCLEGQEPVRTLLKAKLFEAACASAILPDVKLPLYDVTTSNRYAFFSSSKTSLDSFDELTLRDYVNRISRP